MGNARSLRRRLERSIAEPESLYDWFEGRNITKAGFACPCGDMSETEDDLGPCLTCGVWPGFTVCPACGVRCAECFIDQMRPLSSP